MSQTPPFLLDLRSSSGRPLVTVDDGDGGELTLHEWTSWLRIRSDVVGFVAPSISPEDDEITGFVPPVFEDDGIAVAIHLRDHQDRGGGVGLHHARLELTELDAVREAIEQIDWPRLPQPLGGDFNAPHFSLRFASGNLMIHRQFNARSGNFIEAIAPLWRLLGKLMTRAMHGPSGTIEPSVKVNVDSEDPRRCHIRVGLHNRSIGPVALTDPRVPSSSGTPRIAVEIGERSADDEWISPFEWTTLALPALAEDAPQVLLLAARRGWTVDLPWVAPKPGYYQLRVRWVDYDGPVEPLPGQTPFMPVPSKGRAFVGSGPYPIRGCSKAQLRFEISDEQPK